MTLEVSKKNFYMELLRKYGFNCFPIPIYSDPEVDHKKADHRYNAEKTLRNQEIKEKENYGYISRRENGNAILDLDNKESYRFFAELLIKDGFMVIETGKGWQIPVTGITGNIQKMELFDYSIQDTKIIEIQGPKHYCIGPGCTIYHKKLQKFVTYENVGSDKIWDLGGIDFHDFTRRICERLHVEGNKKNRTDNQRLRERFLEGYPPKRGTSSSYFFQASLQCNTDKLTEQQAIEKIKTIYDKWYQTDDYSNRPFNDVEKTISRVYDENLTVKEGRPPRKTKSKIERTGIALEILESRKIYANIETKNLFEDKNGFLENITKSLGSELVPLYPNMEHADYDSIIFKLRNLAKPMPKQNKDLVVFKNGRFSRTAHGLIESDDIASMGFKDYNYLEPTKENEPTKWIEIMFSNTPEKEHGRIKKALKSAITPILDPKISTTHGLSGMGKSAGIAIFCKALGQYAISMTLNDYESDPFIRATTEGKTLLYFQESPEIWKDFAKIKVLTGETTKGGRGLYSEYAQNENIVKIWITANNLPKIPESEKDAMYGRRLSLIHNTRTERYEEDTTLVERIYEEEGEKIISWILNIPEQECKYEDGITVKQEWEGEANPETEFLKNYYEYNESEDRIALIVIKQHFEKVRGKQIHIKLLDHALEDLGYSVRQNMAYNIKKRVEGVKQTTNSTIGSTG